MAGGLAAPLADDDEFARRFGELDEAKEKEGLRPNEGLRSRLLWRTLCCRAGLAPVSPAASTPELVGRESDLMDFPGDFLVVGDSDEGSSCECECECELELELGLELDE